MLMSEFSTCKSVRINRSNKFFMGVAVSSKSVSVFVLSVLSFAIVSPELFAIQNLGVQKDKEPKNSPKVDSVSKLNFEHNEKLLSVRIGEELFTMFDYGNFDKPILFPVYGPGQIGMTRNWPMNDSVAGEAHDHPHHKSMWISHEILSLIHI